MSPCHTLCHTLSHLVTQDNHRSLSSIWHFATPIFPGLHLDSPWILRGWVRRYTHHWNSEENLRAGLSPRHFSPPVHCSSTKDNYHRWDTLQRQHFQRTCPFACKANCATVIPHTKPDKKRACEQVCHLVILHLLFIHKKTQAQSPIYEVSARTIFSGLSGLETRSDHSSTQKWGGGRHRHQLHCYPFAGHWPFDEVKRIEEENILTRCRWRSPIRQFSPRSPLKVLSLLVH